MDNNNNLYGQQDNNNLNNPDQFDGQNPYQDPNQFVGQNQYQDPNQFGGQNPYQNPNQFGGQNPYQNPNPYQGYVEAPPPSKTKAGWALGLGIAAATVPIPVLDIIFALVGFLLVGLSAKGGYKGGLWVAALVLNIIGIILAIQFTVQWHMGILPTIYW